MEMTLGVGMLLFGELGVVIRMMVVVKFTTMRMVVFNASYRGSGGGNSDDGDDYDTYCCSNVGNDDHDMSSRIVVDIDGIVGDGMREIVRVVQTNWGLFGGDDDDDDDGGSVDADSDQSSSVINDGDDGDGGAGEDFSLVI